jgi:hypothetical protein
VNSILCNPRVNAVPQVFNEPTKPQIVELDALLPAILDRAFKGELMLAP